MGGVCRAEHIQVLVRAPRQLQTQSAFPAVVLSSPLSLAGNHCLFPSCPGHHPCSDSSPFLLQEEGPCCPSSGLLHGPSSCHSLRTHPDTSIHLHPRPALSVQQLQAPVAAAPSTSKETSWSKLSTCPDTAPTPPTQQASARDGPGPSHRQGRRQKAAASHLCNRHEVLRAEPRDENMAAMLISIIGLILYVCTTRQESLATCYSQLGNCLRTHLSWLVGGS